jgi:glutamine synthetase
VARDLLKKHFRVVFNGNGYDKSWPEEADKRGIWQIKSGVEAIKRFTDPKNVSLFGSMGVFNAEECEARQGTLPRLVACIVSLLLLMRYPLCCPQRCC